MRTSVQCTTRVGRQWVAPQLAISCSIHGTIIRSFDSHNLTNPCNGPTIGTLKKWAEGVGDNCYSWNNFLPYYEKSCNYTPPDPTRSTNATNHPAQVVSSPARGPLSVSFSNYVDPFGTWAQRALEFVGMSIIDAFNGGCLKGSAYTTVTIDPRNGHRSSSESSFFQDALRHGTVPTVYTNSLAQKILFDENKNAKGITVTTAGSYGVPDVQYRLGARHEIILSAGVFQSPQLLMVSGIGPNATLSKFNISCISDLNGVGKNMWDHSLFGTIHRVNVMTESSALSNSTIAAQNEEAFLVNATGPLSIFGTGYLGFEDLPHPYRSHLSHSTFTSLGTFPDDWPELEWFPVSAYDTIHPDPRDGANYATISTAVVSPSSRGNLTIQSASMSDPPLINPNSYTAAADVELAIAALHRQREVWRYLTDLGIAIGDEVQPGPHVQTDAELLDYIRSTYQPVNHAAATCKMGKRDDPMAVVDSKARVYGVKGLRVVDASAFPFLPPGNPQSTVYALAEKIAEEIVND